MQQSKLNAIIHIGTEKTGTSSIQACLYRNRDTLSKHGYHFIQSAGTRNNRAISACCISPDKEDDFFHTHGAITLKMREDLQRSFIESLHAELTNLSDHTHTIIISSEHLHSRLETQDEVNRLKELLLPYIGNFKIICYLREQSACCVSLYSTHLKIGGHKTLTEFLSNCNTTNRYYNYSDLLHKWSHAFGRDAIHPSLFNPITFINQNLLDDFISKIDLKFVTQLKQPPRKNISLNYSGQIISKALSKAYPMLNSDGTINTQRKSLQKIISKKMPGRGLQASLQQAHAIYDAFKESNELLRKEFFPELDILFSKPLQAKPAETATEEELIDCLSELFAAISNRDAS